MSNDKDLEQHIRELNTWLRTRQNQSISEAKSALESHDYDACVDHIAYSRVMNDELEKMHVVMSALPARRAVTEMFRDAK